MNNWEFRIFSKNYKRLKKKIYITTLYHYSDLITD